MAERSAADQAPDFKAEPQAKVRARDQAVRLRSSRRSSRTAVLFVGGHRLIAALRAWVGNEYWISTTVCCLALMLQPVWSRAPVARFGTMTFGRLALVALGAALAVELLRVRRWPRPGAPELLLLAGLLLLLLIIALSATEHGTIRSQGAFFGYIEFVAAVALILAVASVNERAWLALLLAAAAGTLLSDTHALLASSSLRSGGRLTGDFGNPNYLAYPTATGAAILLGLQALLRGWRRALTFLVLLLPLVTLALTYSRSGALMLAVSLVVVIAVPFSHRRLALAAGVAVLLTAVGIVAYPLFQRLRTGSEFPSYVVDSSGWDPRAEGPIPSGPSNLANTPGGELRVRAIRGGSGVSIPLGVIEAGERVKVAVTATSDVRRLPFFLALEDNIQGNGLRQALAHLTPVPQRLSLEWQPTRTSVNARVYFWSSAPGTQFAISRLQVTQFAPPTLAGAAPTVRTYPTRLLGISGNPAASNFEHRSIASRQRSGALALKLFVQHPLMGIGWERFNSYSVALGTYNPGSAHDQVLTVAAELGIPGVLALLLCAVGLGLRLKRDRFSPTQTASLAPLAGGLIGLFFIDALVTTPIVLPLVATLAVLLGRESRLYEFRYITADRPFWDVSAWMSGALVWGKFRGMSNFLSGQSARDSVGDASDERSAALNAESSQARVAATAGSSRRWLIGLTAVGLVVVVYVGLSLLGGGKSTPRRATVRPPSGADPSGWDATAQGPVAGGSHLSDQSDGGLRVDPAGNGKAGVSYPMPAGDQNRVYVLALAARVDRPATVQVEMEDNLYGYGPAVFSVPLSTGYSRVALAWRPTSLTSNPRFYIVSSATRGTTVTVRNIRLTTRPLSSRTVQRVAQTISTINGSPQAVLQRWLNLSTDDMARALSGSGFGTASGGTTQELISTRLRSPES